MSLLPFDLNLRHLRAVCAIAEHGGVSAAADAVGLSQPALTQGLSKLERQLGVSLFDRRPDGMRATPAGSIVIRRVGAAITHLGATGHATGRGFTRPEQLMTMTQLRAFLSLADSGSFVRAVARADVTQPALHRSVRDLEQVCGVALTERRGRGVLLTSAGRKLARNIRLASSEIAAAITEVRSPDDHGSIVIGAMPLSRARLLPSAMVALLRVAPSMSIDVIEGAWRELVEQLREGVIDLMIGALRDLTPSDLVQSPLFVDRPIVVGRRGHPLAGRPHVSPADLAQFPWIVGNAGSPVRKSWQGLFTGRALPQAPIACGSIMTIRNILEHTDYLALSSASEVAVEIAQDILIPIGKPLAQGVRTIGITTRYSWRPTPGQQRFIDLLRDIACSDIIQENG